MGKALFADISHFQIPASQIDWNAYITYSSQGDGTARLCQKASEGTSFKDPQFEGYWSGGLAHGIGMMAPYHYAKPGFHPGASGAQREAKWFAQVVGARLRPGDRLMLDLEENESSAWALAFGQELNSLFPRGIKLVLYANLDAIRNRLQDARLPEMYDLALAAWHPLEQGPPAAPAPWKTLLWWQWTDNTAPRPVFPVPGIGHADINQWLGGSNVPSVDFKAQQAKDTWATTGYDATTGIHAAWLAALEDKSIVCGPPTGPEFHTIDWAGNPIVVQYFGAGVRIEYYVDAAANHLAGSHHGYTYKEMLW